MVFPATQPTIHASSPGARRGFYARCGTQISFIADYIPRPDRYHDRQSGPPRQVPPALHYRDAERLPWVRLADDLPRHAGFPPVG